MNNKLSSLQIIRAFAAIIVAVVHVWNDGWLPDFIIDFGEFGVDLFFVLSGFIMCLTVKTKNKSHFDNSRYFLYRRIIRIFPIYIICAIPLILYSTYSEGYKGLYYYFGNTLLLPTFTNDPDYKLALPVGWTLVYEMFFYYIFGFFLLFISNKRKLLFVILAFIIVLVLSDKLFGIQGDRLQWVNFSYIIGDTLLLNFVLGIASYFVFEKLKDKIEITIGKASVGLLAICVIAITLISFQFPRFISSGIPSFAIILMFLFVPNSQLNFKFSKKLVFIGNASYSIYLTHFYFAFFKLKFYSIGNMYISNELFLVNFIGISSLIGSVILGCVFYVLIEKPIINLFSNNNKLIKA